MSTGDGALVVIGRIGRPHGLDGQTRAFPTGPTLGSLAAGDRVSAVASGAAARELTLEAIRPADQAFLVRFAGVTTREAAATLTGAELAIPADALPAIDGADEFYVRDLVGCTVLAGETVLGEVVDVYAGAANDALIVRGEGTEDVLVPFTRDAVVDLDVPGRRVRIRPDLFGGDA